MREEVRKAEASPPASAHFDAGGFALVIVSALCYSSLGIFGKVALAERIAVPSMLATRFTIAAAALWAVVAAVPALRRSMPLLRGRWKRLVLWGCVGFAGQSGLFFGALTYVPANLTELLLYTCPAFLAALIWIRTGRRPSGAVLAAIALTLLGTFLATAPERGSQSRLGIGLAIAAGLWYATFLLVLDRVTPGVPSILATACIVSGAALAFVLALPLTGGYAPPKTAAGWGAILGMVAMSTIFGFSLFVAGMKRTGPQVAAILSTFEPLGTILLAALLLGESLRPGQWIGAACILVAAVVLAARQGQGPPRSIDLT